ncbi:MAG: apolipoprotein N-acyltransferase [Rikenellaceae bacterium]|nr:apolipoprotein N-acyltransferase [Rikenellaceae bacterium]
MRNFILALISALLLSCGWLGLGGLPLLVAFIPLLAISAEQERGRAGARRTLRFVALALALWSAATTWWIAMAGSGAWSGAVLSVVITVVLFGGVFMLYHHVSKRAPTVVAYVVLVSAWVAAEYLYTVGEVAFPWLVLGNGFAGNVSLVQWYSATGVFGGTLWVLLCNILIWQALRTRTVAMRIAAGAVVFVPVVASLVIYYTYREPAETITVTVVQPNFHPGEKFEYLSQQQQFEIMLKLAAGAPADVDYILLPETAIDIDRSLDERDLERSVELALFRELLREKYPGARIVTGAMTTRNYMPGEQPSRTARGSGGFYYDRYNAAIRIDTTLATPVHHKSMLVIGVEKMPYAGRFAWLDDLILDMGGTVGNLGVDSVRHVFFDTQGRGIAPSICWEAVFGAYTAEFVRGGANVLFIISNDSWWGRTEGHRQLFRFSRLRAVETRRAIARSANTGISGFIDQRGRVLARTRWDERTTLTGEIALGWRQTLYVRHGDYIAHASVWVFVASLLYGVFCVIRKLCRKRKR